MAIEIRMPELAADMTEADLVSWLVSVGDVVREGDLIAEIETDKATVEFESPVSGVLRELRVTEGTAGIKVGAVLAVLEEIHEEVEAPVIATGEALVERDAPPVPQPESTPAPSDRPAATALARRLASRAGIDLGEVRGTGAGGRIVKADVEAVLVHSPADASADRPEQEQRAEPATIKHTRMRKTIARRMSAAKREIPHFYLGVECDVGRLLEVRKELNAQLEGTRLSLNDFVVKAAAIALRQVPAAHVSWSEDHLLQHDRVLVSVAVATEGGLITPTLHDADKKGLAQIASEMADLAARARSGKLQPKEYSGGTFTVSNLGMYGIERVYAIVNPPQSAILGVGAAESRPVVRGGAITVGTLMTCTLSADHRALDGATGAEWLATFKRLLEEPLDMLL